MAAAVLMGWYGSKMVRGFYLDQTAVSLEARARLSEPQIMALLDRGDRAGVDAIAKQLGEASGTRITVILPDGEVVGDTEEDPKNMDNHARRPEVVKALGGTIGRESRYSMTLQQRLMFVAMPVLRDGKPVAVVRTALPLSAIEETLGAMRYHLVAAALVTIGLFVAVSYWFARRVARPLGELTEGAERFRVGPARPPAAGFPSWRRSTAWPTR